MKTKMNVHVVITPRSKSRELYEKLTAFDANVADLCGKIHVCTEIDIREDTIGDILAICREYGDCEVDARMK